MNIALKAVTGPLQDKVFTVRVGMTIGRQGADIPIPDPRVSTDHGRIVQTPEGQFVLLDNKSKNGIRVNEERVAKVTLRPGLLFSIGDSVFVVMSLGTEGKAPRAGQEAVTAPPRPSSRTQKYWYDALADFLAQELSRFNDQDLPMVPMQPALVLEFVRGVQMNSKWILGYGPRELGSACVDLPIWEPSAPNVCFEVAPTDEGILFKTSHPDIVRLNSLKQPQQILQSGDSIQIQETLIEVDFTV